MNAKGGGAKRSVARPAWLRPDCGGRDGMKHVAQAIARISGTDATVLIVGEAGVEHQMIARALHDGSARRACRFVAIDCASLSPQRLEEHLRGLEPGAVAGGRRARPVRSSAPSPGTVFLDEVSDLPLPTQGELLLALQDRVLIDPTTGREIPVECRFIAGTHTDLRALVEAGRFRADLYYRLDVLRIDVPPLRQRRDELPLLVDYFLSRCVQRYGRAPSGLSDETMALLARYPWPGNVRELEAVIERIVVLQDEAWVAQELGPESAVPPPPAAA